MTVDFLGFVVCLLAAAVITVACRKPADQTWGQWLGIDASC